MRDIKRLDRFYDEVKRIHIQHFPDWRSGQLVSNFFGWLWTKNIDPFFPEESRMIELFREFAGESDE